MDKVIRARQPAAARPPPVRAGAHTVEKSPAKQYGDTGEFSLRRTSDNARNILNSSGIATLVLDRDLKLRFFTPAATSLFKLASANVGRPLAEAVCRFKDDDLLLDAQSVIVTGVSLWREIETDRGASYNRRLLPYRDEDNEIQGVVITFADISEMKTAEREIETARAYANSILDAIHQPLVVLDHEMRVVSASPSFYRSFAISPGVAVGQTLPDLRDRCLDVRALRGFLDRIAAGQDVPDDYEIEIEMPPHGRRVLLLTARKIPLVPPAKQRFLLAIDDITDRKHADEVIETAKQQAERANLGKSRFLAAASHDLRQPLQTMALLQGILASKLKGGDDAKLVARLGESLDAMSAMLNRLLDINQLEAGIVKPEPKNFPINVLFERLRDEFADHAKNKGLTCRVVPSRQNVRSDPTLLEEIIRNLVSNALKYTDHGKILLGCRRRGGKVRIEVLDTGSGIPEGQLRAVFEEFHQLDNPARERARGLGLGLSIVQRLADLLDLTVDVRSSLGKGSVFSVEVPIADSGEAPRTGPLQPAAHAGKGEAILVIEDDPAIRETLRMLFELDGYRVAVASDGNSALEMVALGAVRPDIVVADYNLPNGLTGLEIAARLRATLDKALPVLIVTGDIATDTLRAIAAAGCIQLNKPIKADDLTRRVRAQLAAPRQKPEPSQKHPLVAPVAGELESTVFLVDDDEALSEAMCELFARRGRKVEAFASGEAFLEAYRPGRKGCLLVDARLPGMGGLALLQRLKAENRGLPSIMITGHGDISMAVEAMKAGAIDFIEKPVGNDALLASIERALELTRNSSALTAWREDAVKRIAGLTPRERQIMERVIAGQPNKIIAADLKVSQRTVENHRAAVMKKTRSKSLSDLVRLSITAT